MKKTISIIFALAAMSASFVSCYKQDDVYKEFIKVGGYIYPAKPVNVVASAGENRVVLDWDLPMDPSIRTAKVFWDNKIDSIAVDYASYPDGHVKISVPNLEERSYTFDVVNYDEYGNKSLATELTARPLGSSWLVTHSERYIVSCRMDADTAVITMSKSTDEMVGTKFKVRDLNGEWKEYEGVMGPDETVIRIPGVMKGKSFQFTSGFYETDAADTLWNPNWTKSSMGISYPLDGSGWDIKVTTNQSRDGYGPELIFDGITDNNKSRFFSTTNTTYRNQFPKILSIDTKQEGEPYVFTAFDFYTNPTSVSSRYLKDVLLYIGDSAYDQDDKTYSKDFGNVVMSSNFTQDESENMRQLNSEHTGRYFAIVFKNSRSTTGYIDLWELVPYGYKASEID